MNKNKNILRGSRLMPSVGARECKECYGFPYHETWCQKVNSDYYPSSRYAGK